MGQLVSLRKHKQEKQDQARYRQTREHIADELSDLPGQLIAHALTLASAGTWAAWDEAHPAGAVCGMIPGDLAATGDPRVTALMAAANALEHALDLLDG